MRWSVSVRALFESFVFVHGSCPPSLLGSAPGGLCYPAVLILAQYLPDSEEIKPQSRG